MSGQRVTDRNKYFWGTVNCAIVRVPLSIDSSHLVSQERLQ